MLNILCPVIQEARRSEAKRACLNFPRSPTVEMAQANGQSQDRQNQLAPWKALGQLTLSHPGASWALCTSLSVTSRVPEYSHGSGHPHSLTENQSQVLPCRTSQASTLPFWAAREHLVNLSFLVKVQQGLQVTLEPLPCSSSGGFDGHLHLISGPRLTSLLGPQRSA